MLIKLCTYIHKVEGDFAQLVPSVYSIVNIHPFVGLCHPQTTSFPTAVAANELKGKLAI